MRLSLQGDFLGDIIEIKDRLPRLSCECSAALLVCFELFQTQLVNYSFEPTSQHPSLQPLQVNPPRPLFPLLPSFSSQSLLLLLPQFLLLPLPRLSQLFLLRLSCFLFFPLLLFFLFPLLLLLSFLLPQLNLLSLFLSLLFPFLHLHYDP